MVQVWNNVEVGCWFNHRHLDEKHNPDFRCQSLCTWKMGVGWLSEVWLGCGSAVFLTALVAYHLSTTLFYPRQKLCTARVRLHAKLDKACLTCRKQKRRVALNILAHTTRSTACMAAIYQGMEDVSRLMTIMTQWLICIFQMPGMHWVPYCAHLAASSLYSHPLELRGSCPVHHPKHCSIYVNYCKSRCASIIINLS